MAELKQYWVEIPINGKVVVSVEAEDEQGAIDKAIENFDLKISATSESGYDLEEWDSYDILLTGNVWNGIIYQANAEEQ